MVLAAKGFGFGAVTEAKGLAFEGAATVADAKGLALAGPPAPPVAPTRRLTFTTRRPAIVAASATGISPVS